MTDAQVQELSPIDAARVDLDLLEVGTHALAIELPRSWIAEAVAQTDAVVDQPGVARFELSVQSDRTLLVRGHIEVVYGVPCARCLELGRVDVDDEIGPLCMTYVPAERLRTWSEYTGAPEQEDEIEPLEASELDEIGYEGSKVDLRGLLAEQILLAYPMRVLCGRGEACLGLCMRCGANLNPAVDGPEQAPDRCPACGARRDGADDDAPGATSAWKQALAKVKDQT